MASIATEASNGLAGPLDGRTRAGAVRLDAIDLLRGLVIALMVLDHVRDFFHMSTYDFNATDPANSYPLLYATRWITHLCAPTFVFLAGLSIYLQKANGKKGAELSSFLLSRGAWLIFLEWTIVSFGFNFGAPFLFLQVIWAIGVSMIAMALLARLHAAVVLTLGLVVLLLSPLLAPLGAGLSGGQATLFLLAFGIGPIPDAPAFVAYPVVPWFAVMCLGFGAGPIFRLSPIERDRAVLAISAGLLTAFVALRALNGYGDPVPWAAYPTTAQSVMSFLNVSKYPPSPDYVAATLGLSLLLLLALQRLTGPLARILLDFGRTPLFTYLVHIYIAHGLMLAAAAAVGRPGDATNVLEQAFSGHTFPGWGWSLAVVYGVWIAVLASLVPLSRWMADIKRRRREWWVSYI